MQTTCEGGSPRGDALQQPRALVAGWFSFRGGHATAGNVLARDLACQWIAEAGYAYDVALDPPFSGGVNWRTVDPDRYSHVVFVCGPFSNGPLERRFLARFWKSCLVGLNLSMQLPLEEWSPFDLLIERDSSARVHPDMVLATRQPLVPVAGVCLVSSQPAAKTGCEGDPGSEALRPARS